VKCMACNWVDGYNSAASVFRVEEPFLKMEAAPSSELLVFFLPKYTAPYPKKQQSY
jgi:hypothetical protein